METLRQHILTVVWLLLIAAPALLHAETPQPDREFPRPYDVTAVSDIGPEQVGLELDGENLIPNGNLEVWGERRVQVNPGLPNEDGLWETWNLPQAWTYRHWNGTAFTRDKLAEKTHRHPIITTFQADGGHTGKYALNLGFGRSSGGIWFTTPMFRIEPGCSYVLSLWCKAENVGRGIWHQPYPLKVMLRMFQDPKREHLTGVRAFHRVVKVAPEVSTFDWRELRWQFTAPPDVKCAILTLKTLQARGGFRFLVDDIALHEVTRAPDAWEFGRTAGFGNTRRDGVVVTENGLELAKLCNLVENCGFEEDADEHGAPGRWRVVTSPVAGAPAENAQASATLDGLRHTGARSLKLSAQAGMVRVVSPLIQIEEPGTYTLSVYCRSLRRSAMYPPGYGTVAIHMPMDGTTHSRNVIQYGQGWLRESITFTHQGKLAGGAPTSRRDPGIEIILGFRGQGTIWFDDVQLERATTPSRLASNGATHLDSGIAVSEILEVGWARAGSISWQADVPEGRLLEVRTRTGVTPYHDRTTWTDWSQPCSDARGSAMDVQVTGVPLYLQWQARFRRDDPMIVTPELLDQRYASVADLTEWRYYLGPGKTGETQGVAQPEHDDTAWASTKDLEGPAMPNTPERATQGVVWYRTRVSVPMSVGSSRLFLRLEAADGQDHSTSTALHVNGVKACTRLGAAPTWLDLGPHAAAGGEVLLALRLEGPGSDRFLYLHKSRILCDNGAADRAMVSTPVLRAVRVAVQGPRDRRLQHGDIEIVRLQNGEIRPPLMPFRARPPEVYEDAPKMRALRTLAREIVHDIPDDAEDEQILRLRKHIYTLCNETGSPSAYNLARPNNTPYDFLHLAVQDRLTMYCTHHWQTLTDLATALGFIVRPVTTGNMGKLAFWADNVVEYWSNKHNKWVMINTFFDNYFTREGTPLSAGELMHAWFDDRWHEIESRAGGDITNGFRDSAERAIGPYGWQGIVPHTHANSHGWIGNVYITDNPAHGPGVTLIRPETEPFFIAQNYWTGTMPYTTDYDSLYAPINQTSMRLDIQGDICRVDAEHNMPNFDHFQQRTDDDAWQKCDSVPFDWTLPAGGAVLRLRAVNRFGRAGPEATVALRVRRPFEEQEPLTD